MKNKGFTLVELLAVIVILGVILAIAIPSITSLINSSKQSGFESHAIMVLNIVENEEILNEDFELSDFNIDNLGAFNLNNDNYEEISVSLDENNELYIYIKGKEKWEGLFVCGTNKDMNVYTSADGCNTGGGEIVGPVNAPVLATGMTPIKWVEGVETNTTADDAAWYDYENKLWANAKTADGSYWVWIPRYAYSITSGYQSSTAGTIAVKFLNGTTNNAIDNSGEVALIPTYSGNSQTNYVLHPAFDFGGTQVTGIWISKFEASDNGGKVKIAPNVPSWRGISIATKYNNSVAMETDNTYGWGTTGTGIDTHMMKNTEWGAAAYLSHSSNGINAQIWINPADDFSTGCAGDSESSVPTTGCLYAFDSALGGNASTTGNVTGIFDMSGGAWETVMANLNNLTSSSGLNPTTVPDKHIDRYSNATNYGYNSGYIGDAYYETSNGAYIDGHGGSITTSWYGDWSLAMTTSYPWFARGGPYDYDAYSGSFGL